MLHLVQVQKIVAATGSLKAFKRSAGYSRSEPPRPSSQVALSLPLCATIIVVCRHASCPWQWGRWKRQHGAAATQPGRLDVAPSRAPRRQWTCPGPVLLRFVEVRAAARGGELGTDRGYSSIRVTGTMVTCTRYLWHTITSSTGMVRPDGRRVSRLSCQWAAGGAHSLERRQDRQAAASSPRATRLAYPGSRGQPWCTARGRKLQARLEAA